jgi:hypothetical protein
MARPVWATFSSWVTPTVMVQRGEAWADDDPVVTSHPDWFTSDPTQFLKRSGMPPAPPAPAADVETATAEPGERRTRTRAKTTP